MATRHSHAIAIVAFAILVSIAAVSAHSWLDCVDWRFNDPLAVTDATKRRWGPNDGTCHARARRFEVDVKIFGKMDEVQFFRHYIQKFETTSLACRHNGGTSSDSGSSEGVATPRSGAYAPAKNPYNQVYGTMAQVYANQQLCWTWPAKNHFAHVDVTTNQVHVNWDTQANRASPDLTQAAMDGMRYTSMLWANCPVAGPASNGDSTGTGSELRPCGGCFNVPNYAPGIYTVQWKWPFKTAETETYTSCADIEILDSSTLTPVDCAVSAWSAWGVCNTDCGGGTQIRTRTVTTQQVGTGAACPSLTDSQICNTGVCNNYLSEHVVYADSLVAFSDWSWADATKYSLAATNIKLNGTSSISWIPYSWQAIFFHYDIGAVDTKDYQSISFWIHGGTTGGQSITFSLVTSGATTSSPLFTYPIPTSSVKANQWTQIKVNFADLGFATGAFDGIWWQANSATQQGTVYIDDIYFQHMHSGGAAPIATDLCASVTCVTNSVCVGGTCTCSNGFSGTSCLTAPTISGVTVQSLAGAAVTTLTGGETLTISWTSTGSISTVTLVLEQTGGSVPEPIASQINNAGTYNWMVPTTLGVGSYTVRVSYSSTVSATSGTLTKSSTATATTCTVSCGFHGDCSADTAPLCECRFGWTGTGCTIEPNGITRIRSKIIVKQAYALYAGNTERFATVVRTDLASSLLIQRDQIEIVSGVQGASASRTVITFDLLNGGQFSSSPLSITDTTTLDTTLKLQLTVSDSALNRGTYQYEMSSSINAAGRAEASLLTVAAVTAVALFMAAL